MVELELNSLLFTAVLSYESCSSLVTLDSFTKQNRSKIRKVYIIYCILYTLLTNLAIIRPSWINT